MEHGSIAAMKRNATGLVAAHRVCRRLALDRAHEFGIQLVSVKRDWNTVFQGDSA